MWRCQRSPTVCWGAMRRRPYCNSDPVAVSGARRVFKGTSGGRRRAYENENIASLPVVGWSW